jgi:hypothetical protein
VLAAELAVVGGVDDDGIVEQPVALQERQEIADDLVEVVDTGDSRRRGRAGFAPR